MHTYRGDVQRLVLLFQESLDSSEDDFAVVFEMDLREAVAMAEHYQFCGGISNERVERECREIRRGIEARIEARDERQRGQDGPVARP